MVKEAPGELRVTATVIETSLAILMTTMTISLICFTHSTNKMKQCFLSLLLARVVALICKSWQKDKIYDEEEQS